MKTTEKTFKIAILEDSEFYNKLLTRQVEDYVKALELNKKIKIEVQSYLKPEEFLQNFKEDTDIAFVDYYLGNGITGSYIIRKIRQYSRNCKVVIVSQARNMYTVTKSKVEGAAHFIHKDKDLLARTCFFIEDEVNSFTRLRRYSAK